VSFTVGAPDLLAHGQLLMGIFKKYKQLIREPTNQSHTTSLFLSEFLGIVVLLGGICVLILLCIGLVIHTITYVSSYLFNITKRPQQDGHEAFFCGNKKKRFPKNNFEDQKRRKKSKTTISGVCVHYAILGIRRFIGRFSS
jgi:hypothetical protein